MKALLDSPAVSVFLGTLPLLLTIAWGLFINNKRLDAIDKRLDRIDSRLDRIDTCLDHIETNLLSLDLRLTRVETRLPGSKLVLGD